MARIYPVGLVMDEQPCLVVGGGHIASRKVETLVEAGALVKVVAPHIEDELRHMTGVTCQQRKFVDGDLEGMFVVIAATSDEVLNRHISALSRERGILVNVVDVPELCTFFVPAVIRRGDLLLTVSTGGHGPGFSRKIRQMLETTIGEEYEAYLDIVAECRLRGRELYPDDLEARTAFMQRVLDLDLLPLLREGRDEEARAKALECV